MRVRIYLFVRTRTEVIIHGRADILTLLQVKAYKESRQKRLALKHRKYKLKTAILQYFIDTAANRLHFIGGINLDSLRSRKHTTPERNLTQTDDRSYNLAKLKKKET